MSLLFASSASDLNLKVFKKLGVECVKIPYIKEGKVVEIDEDFDFKGFYSKCKKGINIENYQMTKDDYVSLFDSILAQGDDIVYVHTSNKLVDDTSLLDAKKLLLEKYPNRKFECVDSKNISIGEGMVAYDCAMLYRKGEDVESIAIKSNDISSSSAFFFACNDLKNMEKHGIVSKNLVTTGSALNIRPIMNVNIDGEIELFDRVSGKKKSIAKLLEIIRQYGENVADYPILVVYTTDEDSANELCEKIKETFGSDINLMMERMTPSNMALLGSDILGISFHIHKKLH